MAFGVTGEDGLMHRTAWAGAGVLFCVVGNDGLIEEQREYVVTERDPAATYTWRRCGRGLPAMAMAS